jgi:hypothetical protein
VWRQMALQAVLYGVAFGVARVVRLRRGAAKDAALATRSAA